MDNDLKKKKSDSLLKLALEEEMLQDAAMKKYKADDEMETLHEFSAEHQKRIKKIFKMADRVENRVAYRRRNFQIAAGFAIFLCFSAVTVTQVEAFRMPILQFFMDIKEKSTHLGIREENRLNLPDEYSKYVPKYVPEGYGIVSVEQNESGFCIRYESGESKHWYRYQYYDKMGNLNVDTEMGDVSEEIIHGNPAVVIRKGGEIRIIVDIEKQRFCVSGIIPYEEAIKIMESVKF